LKDLNITKSQSSRWQAMATLPDDAFEALKERRTEFAYNQMVRGELSKDKVRRYQAQRAKIIEQGCTVADLEALAASGRKFGVICPDPPWQQGGPRGCERHYETQTIEWLKKLPVARLAAKNCVLPLWCTGPHSAKGLHTELMLAWGFDPKTWGFLWIKQKESGEGLHTGMGMHTRSNAEICWLGTRGSPLRLDRTVHQLVMETEVIVAPVGEPSEKPDEVYRRIERLYPGPYLELFARKPREGWTTWGNEIKRADMCAIREAAE
jgi:N6-adenosine-specific RNA methylase IME4